MATRDFVVGLNATRRALLAGMLSAVATRSVLAAVGPKVDFRAKLAEIQTRIGGRLGVHVIDTGSQRTFGLNDEDRFAMASTFKMLLAAAVLARVDAGKLSLDQRIPFGAKDMLPHAPVTSANLDAGEMSVHELCATIIEYSNNPAANLLLALVEGPSGLTQFLRSIGDQHTRLDRKEPELNSNVPGDPRDTTTPRSMAQTTRKLLVGEVLSQSSREQLIAWLVNSRTGLRRIRAGFPSQWKVGDKTGTGQNNAVNDVAITWPAGRAPIIAAVYTSESKLPIADLEAAHAQIGELIAGQLSI